MKEVTINNRVYKMRYTLKIFFVYEGIVGHTYDAKGLINFYILCYSCLLASNPDSFDMSFDEFIEYCSGKDGDSIIQAFSEVLETRNKIENQEADKTDTKKKDKMNR